MRSRKFVIVVFALMLFLQGCATFKGAKEGFKEDWKALRRADDWMRENLW